MKFIAKYGLTSTLISDPEHIVCDLFGVYGEKKFMGKTYMGVTRKTFLIDEAGKIVHIFEKVNVDDHANEVLAAFSTDGRP